MLDEEKRARKVLMGTCGWSDTSIQRCGRFYPASCRSAEDRLRHYSTFFSCVEVDTSTYAIPTPASIARWLTAVPKGFVFHFKAFGLFPSSQIWRIFNSRLLPVHQAGALGAVIFQFHNGVRPCDEERAHVEWCRANLDARYKMAVEFRNREWIVGHRLAATCSWLRSLNIALIASDDLKHEMAQPDRAQTGLNSGQVAEVLPIAWGETFEQLLYIRVHRREGNERVLSDAQLALWKDRLTSHLPTNLKGPVYFLWGTDHEDQPVVNAKRLTALLGEVAYNWKAYLATCTKSRRLLGFFREALQKGSAEKEVVVERSGGNTISDQELEEREKLKSPNGESVINDIEAQRSIESRTGSEAEMNSSNFRQCNVDGHFEVREDGEGRGGCDNIEGWLEEDGRGGIEGGEGDGNGGSLHDSKNTRVKGFAKKDSIGVGMLYPHEIVSQDLDHSKERRGKRKDVDEEYEKEEIVKSMIAPSIGVRVVAPTRRPNSTSKRKVIQPASRSITSFFKSTS